MATDWRPVLPAQSQRVWRERATNLWAEARPSVQLVFALRVVAGAGLPTLSSPNALLLPMGWLMLSTSIYLFNGLSDLDGDRLNGSQRPLATGRLAKRDVRSAIVGLAVAGAAICATVSLSTFVLAIGFLLLGWAYSAGPAFKDRAAAASATIGLGAGLSYAAGLSQRHGTVAADLAVAATLVVWVAVASNSKDLTDIVGDTAAGRRTLAIQLGPRGAAWVVGGCTVLAAVGVLWTSDRFAPLLTDPSLCLVAGSVVFAVILTQCARSSASVTRRSGYRAYMACQYLLNAALLVSS